MGKELRRTDRDAAAAIGRILRNRYARRFIIVHGA